MKKIRLNLFALGILALMQSPSFAQNKKVNPDHINVFQTTSAETNEVKIDALDAVSHMEYVKFKIKINNSTSDYIIYKPQESKFNLQGTELNPQDKKSIIIQPLDKESKVLDVKTPSKNGHVDAFKYNVNGLYKIPVDVPATEAPNFKLPASSNDFTAGHFKVELLNVKKETDETAVKFKVTYIGDGIGFVDPKKVSVYGKSHKSDNEQTVVNEKKTNLILLQKGESDTFTLIFHMEGRLVDMQLSNMEILWKDAFKESKLVKIDGTTLEFTLDPALTDAKNK